MVKKSPLTFLFVRLLVTKVTSVLTSCVVLRAPARRRPRAQGEEVGGFPRDRSARIDSSRPAAVAVSAVAQLAAVWWFSGGKQSWTEMRVL